jgi:hypothetical protein
VALAGYVAEKSAWADIAALITRSHIGVVPLDAHAPVQPRKVWFALGVAVRVTCVFWGYVVVHVVGHEIAAGDDVTTPKPDVVIVSDWGGGGGWHAPPVETIAHTLPETVHGPHVLPPLPQDAVD